MLLQFAVAMSTSPFIDVSQYGAFVRISSEAPNIVSYILTTLIDLLRCSHNDWSGLGLLLGK